MPVPVQHLISPTRFQKPTAHIGGRTFNATHKTTPEQLKLFDALNLPGRPENSMSFPATPPVTINDIEVG